MYLKKISLVNFKNFESFEFNTSEKINCFIGDNGIGKTNILDSIHYLSFCKSFLNPIDKMNIRYGEDYFIIDGLFIRNEEEESIYCSVQAGKNKSFRKNGAEYQKLSDHIGFIPLVYSTPTDINLIHGGSEIRRKFVDSIISQFDKAYLHNIIKYHKALEHRNILLKNYYDTGDFDINNLESWDMQLSEYGTKIHKKRCVFAKEIKEIFRNYYSIVSNDKEQVDFIYNSQLNDESLDVLLKKNTDKDRILKFTTCGIHKDDFEFLMDSYLLRKFGSQGQQKSYTMSLKFAQFDYIKKNLDMAPILLLDDIFDKLDKKRVVSITDLVSDNGFGQIFITDTSYNRMPNIFNTRKADYKILNLSVELGN